MPLGLTLIIAALPLLLLWPALAIKLWPLLWWAAASLVAFCLYGLDKQRARCGQWRIPEKLLHFTALLGGWSGAILGSTVVAP